MLERPKNYHPEVHLSRLVHRNKQRTTIRREGVGKISRKDFYINSISTSWFKLIFFIVCLYIALNTFFASLYLLQDGSIENARAGSFADAFFFSVQTLATIGYGKMSPQTIFANILVAVEAFTGLLGLALATGIVFSKISRPSTRILFGNKALISSYKNNDCLIFRLGNLRNNQIADPTIKAVLICDEASENDSIRRSFHDLELIRNNVPLLMPSWTARHQITKNSPLFGTTKEALKEKNVEIIVSLIGFDETLSQTVHAHYSYIANEIAFGGNFVDIISWDKKGAISVNYKHFHDITYSS